MGGGGDSNSTNSNSRQQHQRQRQSRTSIHFPADSGHRPSLIALRSDYGGDGDEDHSSVTQSSMAASSFQGGRSYVDIYNTYRSRLVDKDAPSLQLWQKLAIRSSPKDTPPQEIAKRATFMLICMLKLGACVIWAAMFYFLGHPMACSCPVIYYLGVSGAMSSLSFEGAYERFVVVQLCLILLLPFMVHFSLGGLEESGGVLLWGFLAPLGSAFFQSSQASISWFQAYIALCLAAIAVDFYKADTAAHTEILFYWTMNIVGVLLIVFASAVFFAQALEKEFARSENLLHNILPPSIAKRIKLGENPILDRHASVSILFADVVGFTKSAASMPADVIIEGFLQDLFHLTDQAADQRGLTKIKTIGDAYMVVGGVENSEHGPANHTAALLRLAADMLEIVQAVNAKAGTNFEIRIGIHVGPAIAGVLGCKRPAFDVWGDTVNTASRMESHGKASHVHLTQDAYDAVKGECSQDFLFEWVGEIDVKSKGKMVTFLAKPRDHTMESFSELDLLEEADEEETDDLVVEKRRGKSSNNNKSSSFGLFKRKKKRSSTTSSDSSSSLQLKSNDRKKLYFKRDMPAGYSFSAP